MRGKRQPAKLLRVPGLHLRQHDHLLHRDIGSRSDGEDNACVICVNDSIIRPIRNQGKE